MAAIELKTFADLYTAVFEELGIPLSDTTRLNRTKRDLNIIYQEVVGHSRWTWMLERTSIRHRQKYITGTVAVTEGSAAVTLSVAPVVGDGDSGSFINYKFKVDGREEIHDIETHTALSTSITLVSEMTSETSPEASYKIWRDRVDLPTDCREIVEAWLNSPRRRTLEGLGMQEFRQRTLLDPVIESFPIFFNQADHFDPTSGTPETESDRFRIMRVHPSINNEDVTIHLDYTKELIPFDADTDEPFIPIEDRLVLLYGALSRAWVKERNPEEHNRNRVLYQQQLQRMVSRTPDGFDKPRIGISSSYMALKRGRRFGIRRD